jgi:cell division septation protein DedD
MKKPLIKKNKKGVRKVKRRPKRNSERPPWMFPAALASMVIMIILGYALFGLLEEDMSPPDPPRKNNEKGREDRRTPDDQGLAESDSKTNKPKIMFYEELESRDKEETVASRQPPSRIEHRADDSYKAAKDVAPSTPVEAPSTRKPIETNYRKRPLTRSKPENSGPINPDPVRGKRMYTVQVGAFSNPTLAQQWARQWEQRGFKVTIKPVARPGVGVLYRLLLGEFYNKEDADSLVERLKINEGISALRLMVRK